MMVEPTVVSESLAVEEVDFHTIVDLAVPRLMVRVVVCV